VRKIRKFSVERFSNTLWRGQRTQGVEDGQSRLLWIMIAHVLQPLPVERYIQQITILHSIFIFFLTIIITIIISSSSSDGLRCARKTRWDASWRSGVNGAAATVFYRRSTSVNSCDNYSLETDLNTEDMKPRTGRVR